ncbi:SCO2400 family protein [Streptomyces scopuliridis]
MDYCPQCRRHLNGALICAGCGTPAEELRQHHPVHPGAHHSRLPGGDEREYEGHGEHDAAPVSDYGLVSRDRPDDTAPRRESSRRKGSSRRAGRAKGARDRAPRRSGPRRARSRRGRRFLLGVLGVILAAGVLSLAELARESSGNDNATSVKEETPVDFDGGPQDTERPAAPDDPGVSATPEPGSGTGTGGEASPDGGGGPTASEKTGASPSASASATPETGVTATGDPESPGADDPGSGTTGPAEPTDGPTSGGPTSAAPPPPRPPAPSPSPSETCTWWFLFCV